MTHTQLKKVVSIYTYSLHCVCIVYMKIWGTRQHTGMVKREKFEKIENHKKKKLKVFWLQIRNRLLLWGEGANYYYYSLIWY
jgi:hypothetical protein